MKITENIDIRFPKSLAEALRLQAGEKTRGKLLAGGTDLMVQWAAGVPVPERAVSVWNLPELSAIEIFPGFIEIGAGVTHAFLRDCKPRVPRREFINLRRKPTPRRPRAMKRPGGATRRRYKERSPNRSRSVLRCKRSPAKSRRGSRSGKGIRR